VGDGAGDGDSGPRRGEGDQPEGSQPAEDRPASQQANGRPGTAPARSAPPRSNSSARSASPRQPPSPRQPHGQPYPRGGSHQADWATTRARPSDEASLSSLRDGVHGRESIPRPTTPGRRVAFDDPREAPRRPTSAGPPNGQRAASSAAAPPARRGSAKERMAELQDLLSAELISQAEFNAKRQAILASI